MRNKILIILLIACILTGALNQKKVQATEVAVTIGVEVLIYLVTQSIAGGVAISDIFDRRTAGDDYVTGITLKDGNTVMLPGGVKYKLSPSFTDSISKNITLQTLSELTNSVTITGNTMKVDTLSDDVYQEMNSLNELIRNNPKLKSYMNSNTLTGKTMNPNQLETLKVAFNKINSSYNGGNKISELVKDYPYYIILNTAGIESKTKVKAGTIGYTMYMSNRPIFIFNVSETITGNNKGLYYTPYKNLVDSVTEMSMLVLKDSDTTGTYLVTPEMSEFDIMFEFWNNNLKVIGNGMMVLGYEEYIRLGKMVIGDMNIAQHGVEQWEHYVEEIASKYYSLPISNLLSMSIDTYNPYPKDDVRVKENEDIVFENISTLDDLDTYFDYVNVGAMQDLADGKTIDNTDSQVRDKVINPALDRSGAVTPPVESDSWLDKLLEWFNTHLTALGTQIVSGITSVLDAIWDLINDFYNGVISAFGDITDAVISIGDALEWLWELISDGVISGIESIGKAVDSILEFLLGLIEGLITRLRELLISLFVPSDGYLDAKVLQLRTRFSFADGIIKIVKGFDSALTGNAPPIVKLGSLDEGNKYGINNYVLMDLAWFKRYKPTTDIIMSAALWVIFIWRLFIKLPGIIAGYSAMTYADAKIDEYNNKQGKGD